MRPKRWALTAAAVVVAVTTGVVLITGAHHATAGVDGAPPSTAPVERGKLADQVSQYGTLTYRARLDGAPYSVIDQAHGTYTELPAVGDTVSCGHVLYRVDDHPVLLLCGGMPAYRSLSSGDTGADVDELNVELVRLGFASKALLDPSDGTFGSATATALAQLQAKLGEEQTGSLGRGQVVFLPEAVRIAAVTAVLGGAAQPGAPTLSATSSTPEVHVGLDPSEQGAVRPGDRALITLPNSTSVTGHVTRVGAVAVVPSAQGPDAGATAANPTIPVYISVDHPETVRGFDQAPVQVEITTAGVVDALSVPVTAIVATAGGGFAVEVVRADGRRELVAVTLGLFDDAEGRVQVDGDLHEGDRVVVPSP